jgi:protein gp37
MCDPFDKQAPSSWRREFFALIDACPNLDFLLLTKRPQNIGKSDTLSNLPNVWLGVTAENQREADRRIPLLQEIPATIRFVCIEPMLSPVRLDLRGISWVIVGGESGPRARHMPADWARDVRDQCRTAGVPLFVKQMSRREPIPDDLMVREFPA